MTELTAKAEMPTPTTQLVPTRTGTDRRKDILSTVTKCVCNDRQNTYGDAEDNFSNIATIANVLLGKKLLKPLDALDVAMISAAIKMARLSSSPRHLDNWVDLAGYATCGGGIVLSESEKHST